MPELSHFDRDTPTTVSHDYVKAIYRTQLDFLPAGTIVSFWERNPLRLNGKDLSTAQVLELLWADRARVPLAWDYQVGEALEAVLAERGISIRAFYDRMLFRNNRSTFQPGRDILKWVYPFIRKFFHLDPRDMIINLIPHWVENAYPRHIHRRVKRVERGDWVDSILVFITDREFRGTIPFDFEIQCGMQVMAGPRSLGLPAFESVGVLADCRPVVNVLWEGAYASDGKTFTIDGKPAGRHIPFSAFCRERDIDLREFAVPDSSVQLMEIDIECPRRRRVVLHAGSVYGAPANLQAISHRKTPHMPENLLEHLVQDLAAEGIPPDHEAENKHLGILARLRDALVFTYHAIDESMDLDGQHLVKGVPAKILRKLISTYVSEGRSEFQYREFKRDFEISLGQKNANFEVRFTRLVERVSERAPDFRIEIRGRGRFALIAARPVALLSD